MIFTKRYRGICFSDNVNSLLYQICQTLPFGAFKSFLCCLYETIYFHYFLVMKLKCGNCGEISDKWQYITLMVRGCDYYYYYL